MTEINFRPLHGTDAIDCGDDPTQWADKLSDRLDLKLFSDEQFRVRRVETILVGLHSLCNLDCPFCGGHYSAKRDLLPKQFLNIDRLIEQVQRHKNDTGYNIGTINWGCTGEVLIHPKFEQVIVETQAYVDSYDMLTNLSIKNERLIRFIAEHSQFKYITISCDAGDPETYDRIRPGGDFNLVVKNADILSKGGKKLSMRAIVYQENLPSLRRLPALLKEKGFESLHLIYTYDSPETVRSQNYTKLDYGQFKQFYISMLAECQKLDLALTVDPSFYIPDMVGVIPGFETVESLRSYSHAPCANLYRMTFLPDGSFFNCCHMNDRGYFKSKQAPEFYHKSLLEIFDNEEILTHRKLQALGYFPDVCQAFCSKIDKPVGEHESFLRHSLKHPDTQQISKLADYVASICSQSDPIVVRALSPAIQQVIDRYPELSKKIAFVIDKNPSQSVNGLKMISPEEFAETNPADQWSLLIASDRETVFNSVLGAFSHFREIHKLHFFEPTVDEFKVQKLFPLTEKQQRELCTQC